MELFEPESFALDPSPQIESGAVQEAAELISQIPAHKLAEYVLGLELTIERQTAALAEGKYNNNHDELTGLLNLRGFKAALGQARPGAYVTHGDATNFKAVNDYYGHARGDTVLQDIGEVLQNTFRRNDAIARIGGDEFMILFNPATSPKPGTESAYARRRIISTNGRIYRNMIRYLQLPENTDLWGAGLEFAIGSAQWEEGVTLAELKAATEEGMRRTKNLQHTVIGTYRRSNFEQSENIA